MYMDDSYLGVVTPPTRASQPCKYCNNVTCGTCVNGIRGSITEDNEVARDNEEGERIENISTEVAEIRRDREPVVRIE